MVLAPEVVADIPQSGRSLAGHSAAALNALGTCLLDRAAVTANRRPKGTTCNGAAHGCQVVATTGTHLVTQNATDQGAHDGTRDIGRAGLGLRHLAAFDPASLFRRTHHSANRRHVSFIQAFAIAPAVVIDG
jgi:hypothetical protein